MSVEVLVSTMNQKDKLIVKTMNINSDCIIINQCDREGREDYIVNDNNIKIINSLERGLSKSRNMAIKNASCDYCLISDDDVELIDEYKSIIEEAFKRNPDFDILAFQVVGKDRIFKNYGSKEKKLNYLTSMKVSSVEIAFRLESIKRNKIKFNELIGAGSKYKMGEENEFLYKCLRKGLKIKYIPEVIASIYCGDSTWFDGFNDNYFYNKGAAFTAMSRRYSIPLIIQFLIRHGNLYEGNKSKIELAQLMFSGRKSYLEIEDEEK